MKKLLKYCFKLYRGIDISPLDNTHLTFKILIFFIWGINVLFFITRDTAASDFKFNLAYKYKTPTLTIQVSPLALPEDNHIELFTPSTGVISSNSVNLIPSKPKLTLKDRSPPTI